MVNYSMRKKAKLYNGGNSLQPVMLEKLYCGAAELFDVF